MEQGQVTGCCYYWDEKLAEMQRIAKIILIVLMTLMVVLSVWTKEPLVLLVDVSGLVFL